jgi:hypothetical protein
VAARQRQLTPHASARHFFGAELRYWRSRHQLSQAQLGRQVFVSADLIRKVELAERFPSLELTRECDHVLQTGGVLGRLLHLVEIERARHTNAVRHGANSGASATRVGSSAPSPAVPPVPLPAALDAVPTGAPDHAMVINIDQAPSRQVHRLPRPQRSRTA